MKISTHKSTTATNLWCDIVTLASISEPLDTSDDLSVLNASIITDSSTDEGLYSVKGERQINKDVFNQRTVFLMHNAYLTNKVNDTRGFYDATLYPFHIEPISINKVIHDPLVSLMQTATEKQVDPVYSVIRAHFRKVLDAYCKAENGPESKNLNASISKINSLVEDEDEDFDDKFLAPSESNVAQMKDFIVKLYNEFSSELPAPSFSADGKEGIEASWHVNNRYIQLIIPAGDKKPYIFQKEGNKFSIEKLSDMYELIEWINWLLETQTSKVD